MVLEFSSLTSTTNCISWVLYCIIFSERFWPGFQKNTNIPSRSSTYKPNNEWQEGVSGDGSGTAAPPCPCGACCKRREDIYNRYYRSIGRRHDGLLSLCSKLERKESVVLTPCSPAGWNVVAHFISTLLAHFTLSQSAGETWTLFMLFFSLKWRHQD